MLQALGEQPPAWSLAVLIAVFSTLITAVLWGFLRELGLAAAVGVARGWSQGMSVLDVKLMRNGAFHSRMFWWELFSMSRWWLLFGVIAILWMAAAAIMRRWRPVESASTCARRLLAFGPWLVVVEVALLVGVWTVMPMVVPEPSTGFVEGIFNWDKWHWDCWRGSIWINRGLIATLVIGTIFYRYVLRWRWSVSIGASACTAPPALMLSVAWMVLHSNPDLWVRATGYFWRLLS